MFPPTQLDLITRYLLDLPLGFFASRDYLDKHGHPGKPDELFQQVNFLVDSPKLLVLALFQSL